MRKKTLLCALLLMFTAVFGIVPAGALPKVEAAAAYSVYIEGKSNYDYAQQVLKLMNEERMAEGEDPLVMDKGLLATAMQRAAELTVRFDHERPNGEMCFTANDRMYGENVAVGQSGPSQVMQSWMNSEGHRANILTAGYQSVGVGVFYHNGVYYWVQCFGYDTATESTKTGTVKKTYEVSVKGKLAYRINTKTKITMKKGGTKTLTLKTDNMTVDYFTAKLLAKSGKWSSSKPSVVSVSKTGKLTAKKKGTAVISCKLGGKTKKITVKVK